MTGSTHDLDRRAFLTGALALTAAPLAATAAPERMTLHVQPAPPAPGAPPASLEVCYPGDVRVVVWHRDPTGASSPPVILDVPCERGVVQLVLREGALERRLRLAPGRTIRVRGAQARAA